MNPQLSSLILKMKRKFLEISRFRTNQTNRDRSKKTRETLSDRITEGAPPHIPHALYAFPLT